MPEIKCPCGTIVSFTNQSLIGRKRYCSKACLYRFRVRPSGLTYKLVKENPTSFKKGHKTWNAGLAGTGVCQPNSGSISRGERRGRQTEFTSETSSDSRNSKWKGDEVGYFALHGWVHRRLGKPTSCAHCGTKKGRIEWANRSHEYRREEEDWLNLCKKCHIRYDKDSWGEATKLWSLSKKRK